MTSTFRSTKTLAQVVTAGALLAASSATAFAQEAPPAEAHFERVVASFEGLGVLSDRYGLGIEAVLSPRNALTFYPWLVSGESKGGPDAIFNGADTTGYTHYDVTTRAFGLDFQYRRYFGLWRGARGFFVAPGLEVAHFVTQGTACNYELVEGANDRLACTGPNRQSWNYLGASLDAGGQAILPYGFTLGASVGAHLRGVVGGSLDDTQMPGTWNLSHGSGLHPRLRAWLGFAFL